MYCRLRKLTTLAFNVFEWLERIEPNSTALYDQRIRSKSVHPWASAEIFLGEATSKFCLSFSDCWRYNANKRLQNALPFLPHYSVLLEPLFSIFCLKWFVHFGYQKCFFFINCLTSIFRTLSMNKPLFRNNQWPEPYEQWKTKLDNLAKLFHAMRSRTRPVTSLGHQVGRRVFREEPQFFKLCPTHFSRGAIRPPLVPDLSEL